MATWGQSTSGAWGQEAPQQQQQHQPSPQQQQSLQQQHQQPQYQQPQQPGAYGQQPPPPGGYAQSPPGQAPGQPPNGYYQQQPPGCCAPQDPNAPPQPGCFGPPQQPGQPGPQGGCCDPDAPFMLPPERSACGVVTTCCDCTFMFAIFLVLCNTLAFGLVVGLKDVDDLFSTFGLPERATLNLQTMMVNSGSVTVSRFAFATSDASSGSSIPTDVLVATTACTNPKPLLGGYGDLCLEDSLTATTMIVQISHWVNFRNTIYFLNLCGSLLIPIYVFLIHRMRNPTPQWVAGQPMPMAPPVSFYGTPFYHVMRACWFVVSLVVFFWMATEMYQFWWFIDLYLDYSTGALHTFWLDFNNKMIATVVIGGTFLCWPFFCMVLEFCVFILGFLPWYGVRAMCLAPNIDAFAPPADQELEDAACCRRLDRFFTEFYQLKRLGFSTKMWVWLTGSRDAFIDCCDQPVGYNGQPVHPPPPPPPQHFPGAPAPMGGAPQAPGSPARGNMRGDEDDQVMTDTTGSLAMSHNGSLNRGHNVAPPPAPGGSSNNLKGSQSWVGDSTMRSSAAFSMASEDSDVGDLRRSKSKSHKSKKHKKSHESDDDNDVRKSKDKSKKKKSKKDKD